MLSIYDAAALTGDSVTSSATDSFSVKNGQTLVVCICYSAGPSLTLELKKLSDDTTVATLSPVASTATSAIVTAVYSTFNLQEIWGSVRVRLTASSSISFALLALVISDVIPNAEAVDRVASANGTSAYASSGGTAATRWRHQILVGAVGSNFDYYEYSGTWNYSFTRVRSVSAFSHPVTIDVGYRVVDQMGNYEASVDLPSTKQWGACIVTYRQDENWIYSKTHAIGPILAR